MEYKYTIVENVQLSEKQFKNFISDLKYENEDIYYYLKSTKIDINDNLHCIKFYCESSNIEIITYSAGYKYARYIYVIVNT